jgi:hypothetical protein
MGSWVRAGEDFGGSRQPRRLGALIPAAVIAIALVAGLILGRATAPEPVQVRIVPLAPGSTRVESGVPVGYQHTRQGAIDAATNYVVTLDGPMLLQPDGLRRAEDLMAATEYRAELETQTAKAVQALESYYGFDAHAKVGATPVVKLAPIAYRVDAYRPSQATVTIWAVWLLAEEGLLIPQQNWITTQLAVTWQGGDWKLSASGTHPGPAPQPVQVPIEMSTPLPPELTEFQEYRHVG